MNEEAFVAKKRPDWDVLGGLVQIAQAHPGKLSPNELKEFVRLYRAASKDLALARTQSLNQPLVDYLNDLVGKAYATLYTYRRPRFRDVVQRSLETVAQTARRRWPFLAASASLFWGTCFFFLLVMQLRPDLKTVLSTPGMETNTRHWQQGLPSERTSDESMQMSAFYASNNPRVAIIVTGVSASTFGIGTVYMMVQNGRMLGELSSAMADVGKLPFLYSQIAPHGVHELSGAIFSGAAGLYFGWALFFPGQRKRGDALREAGKDGMILCVTSVAMMFMAAPIEGYFSFNQRIPIPAKVVVSLLEVVAYTAFWMGVGRTTTQSEEPRTK